MCNPEVTIPSGRVRGRVSGGVLSFLGLPFAEPPTGSLRFAAPEARRRWDGVRDATRFGPAPVQASLLPHRPSLWQSGDGFDTLTLNVWAPEDADGDLPVMVWIYGGAFCMGSSSEPYYEGSHFARSGVVLVTVNYRVGFEGFGSVEGAPDNRGILDQLAALSWVQENIAAFGGDPSRVTVFGESAGGTSVAVLLNSPKAHGLFIRAISSSPAGKLLTPDRARLLGTELARGIGRSATVAELSQVPTEQLLQAQAALFGPRGIAGPPVLGPVIDGLTVMAEPVAAMDHAQPSCDLLVGANADEATIFTASMGDDLIDAAAMAETLNLSAEGLERYRAAFPSADERELHTRLLSDGLFRMTAFELARAHAHAGIGRTYRYELTWPTPALDGALGACHALDLPLVFGNLTTPESLRLLGGPADDSVASLSAEMHSAWVAFAATGDPGPEWSATTGKASPARLLDTPSRTDEHHLETVADIWLTASERLGPSN